MDSSLYIIMFSVVLSLVGVMNNLGFIFTIVRNKDLQTPSNRILLSLAVSDFLVSAIVFPFSIANDTHIFSDLIFCVVAHSIVPCAFLVTVLHLLVVSVERHIAIVYSLRHRTWVTDRRLNVAILICWILPIALSALPVLGWRKYFGADAFRNGSMGETCDTLDVLPCSFLCFILAPMAVICFFILLLYVPIFRAARRQANAFKRRNIPEAEPKCTSVIDIRPVAVIFLTVGYFALSSLPVTFGVFVQCAGVVIKTEVWFVLMFLAFSNSVVNPLIYGLGNRQIRHVFCSSFSKMNKCRRGLRITPQNVGKETET